MILQFTQCSQKKIGKTTKQTNKTKQKQTNLDLTKRDVKNLIGVTRQTAQIYILQKILTVSPDASKVELFPINVCHHPSSS
jgi:hypothetical protein